MNPIEKQIAPTTRHTTQTSPPFLAFFHDCASDASAPQTSMDQLVNAAVELVEQGQVGQAVEVLRQGIDILQVRTYGSMTA